MTEDLAEKLAAAAPLDGVRPETARAVAEYARERQLQSGETLLHQGEAAAHVYLVVDGQLRAVLDHGTDSAYTVAVLEAGAVLGEIAVLTGGRRETTIVADTSATVVEISAAGFELLLEREAKVAGRLTELATARLRQAQLARQIRSLFPEVDEAVHAAILSGVDWVRLEAGEHLVERGDPADTAYIVVSGRLRAVTDDRAEDVLAEIGPGELVGEMALVEDGTRAATLVAIRDTHVARLARDDFLAALRGHPESLLRITRTALRRATDARQPRGGERRSIALVAAHSSVELPAFAEALVRALRPVGTALVVTSRDVHAVLGTRDFAQGKPQGPRAALATQWLQEQEECYDTLLLQTDPDWSAWNELVLRHADHVAVIADASADPAPTAIEERIREALRGRMALAGRALVRESLILLHSTAGNQAPELPRGTAQWLAVRPANACYHVRCGHAGDLSRLARIIAERPIGLVLSGGGARGFAHLGVVRALQEAGVPVDIVAGTSMGAVMATFVAFDVAADEQVARAKAALKRTMLDWTLPLAGLIKGGKMAELADDVTGGRDIEDLWLPWFAVSTNLTRSEVSVLRRGSITRALRASVAIPGIVPPVVYGDELHVDGGVFNNLPVEPMRRINPRGLVIAVDVTLNSGPRAPEDFGLSVSGWGLLARRLLPGRPAPQVPTIAATLVQSMIAGSSRERDRVLADGLADLYLDLDLPRCGLFDFNAADRIIAAGHAAAAPRVREWAAALPPGFRVAGNHKTPDSTAEGAPLSGCTPRTD